MLCGNTDICASWVSHFPLGLFFEQIFCLFVAWFSLEGVACILLAIENSPEFPDTMRKICATGMNSLELGFNDQLTGGFKQKDLNLDPTLQYEDASFDVVTCVVSIGK